MYFWAQNAPIFPDTGAIYNFIPGVKYRVTGGVSYQASGTNPFTLQILLTSTDLTIGANHQYVSGLPALSSQSIVQTYYSPPNNPTEGFATFDWVFTAPNSATKLGAVVTFGFTPSSTGLNTATKIITVFQATANNISSPANNPTAFGAYTTPGMTVTVLGT
jgi:hypothetical protein